MTGSQILMLSIEVTVALLLIPAGALLIGKGIPRFGIKRTPLLGCALLCTAAAGLLHALPELKLLPSFGRWNHYLSLLGSALIVVAVWRAARKSAERSVS